ncbi:MAG: DUF4129 domain-containing protein [Planctomycetes bacterium]|nr:DUF4129 domain-containing protein [Planctomycetota bacterium]
MPHKPRPTLIDYVITSISPLLIMALVGSLVFFLIEILYAGDYEGRLLWTLFFFVVGIVLVARISIQLDAARAAFYGLGLAGASWLALKAFINYPTDSPMANYADLINLFLIGVVWWCAHRLTCDCTFIDEKRQSSGKGLLASAGWEALPETAGQARDDEKRSRPATLEPNLSLLQRWQRFREQRKNRPHAPGLTVVWFSLAALPIFGLGQSLIPAGDAARRAFTFWLAFIYVGSALCLLLTTSFLGLRRYMRQRKLQMPRALAAVWLSTGAVLIAAFLLVGAILPRPYSETPIAGLDKLISPERDASRNAVLKDSGGKNDGKSGRVRVAGEGSETQAKGKPDPSGEGKSDNGTEKDGERSGSRSENIPETKIGNALEKIVDVVKWIVFVLVGIVIAALLFWRALKYLANFMPGVHRWLEAIAAWWTRRRSRKRSGQRDQTEESRSPTREPFARFANPFDDGTAAERTEPELIAYSFKALEAWAAERNLARYRDETPLEFGSRMSNSFNPMADDVRQLAILVVRVAYANGTLPADARETLAQFWERLMETRHEPVQSAEAVPEG